MGTLLFAAQSRESRAHDLPPERIVNFLPETAGDQDGTPFYLLPTCGLMRVAEVSGAGRGVYYQQGAVNDQLLVVAGSTAYRVSRGYSTTTVGAVTAGTTRARFAGDRSTTVIITRPDGYVYTGGAVTQITDVDFNTLDILDIGYLRGRWIALEGGSGRLIWSALDDPTSWSGLAFATTTAKPDDVVGLAILNETAYVFGSSSVEAWVTTEDPDLPFRRYSGGVIERGCAAAASIVSVAGRVFFVGDNRRVLSLPEVGQSVSHSMLNEALDGLSREDLAACEGRSFHERGHDFYALDVPGRGTFVYDLSSGLWHERATYGATLWRARDVANYDGVQVACSRDGGGVYALTAGHYFDDEAPIVRVATVNAPIDDGHAPISAVALHATPGVGLDAGAIPGRTPRVFLRYSDDRGAGWSASREALAGALGATTQVIRWNRLGRARPPGRVFEVSYSDPVPLVFRKLIVNPRHA
jgi:hypothetical protein